MPLDSDWFAQRRWRVRTAWGASEALAAAQRGDRLVIVDTLRFSTAVVATLAAGAQLRPARNLEVAAREAETLGARHGRAWLSPRQCALLQPGERLVLASPNGATCARCADFAQTLWVGAPVCASAVARAVVANLAENPDAGVTLVACGERRAWDDNEEGDIRFALEDWIGVGAIAVHLDLSRSPETHAAVDAYRGAAGNLLETLRQCGSGIELEAKGHADDIAIAADVDRWDIAPRLTADGWFVDDRKAPTTT